jgi:uncharacterized membrane protein YgdD (TMEM256/DUF423 family)
MSTLFRICLVLAALFGFAAVFANAYGAHGAADPQAREFMRIGATFATVQALAVFAAAFAGSHSGRRTASVAAVLFVAGLFLFCGSLWAVALGAPKTVTMATPVGGLAIGVGWLALAWACLTLRKPA